MSTIDKKHRSHLPMPNTVRPKSVMYDAKDPDSHNPPIPQLRPPEGAPNVLLILIDDAGFGSSSAFGGHRHYLTNSTAARRDVMQVSLVAAALVLGVIVVLGFGHSWLALWIIPLGFLVGLAFGAFGLIMNALAPGYDFFTYFFTLVLTPMLLLSGVFFPVEQLPPAVQAVAVLLPLNHAVELVRPLLLGRTPDDILLHFAALLGVTLVGYHVALVLCRRRMIK